MTTKLFGTDGIRGRANTGILTPESLIRLGRAISAYHSGSCPRVLLGHDGRRSSGMIRGALAAGLLGSGSDVVDIDLITTPGLSYLTRTLSFDLGIMVSASHNPAHDNGIKVFNCDGFKIPGHEEDHIEEILAVASQEDETLPVGAFATAPSLVEDYRAYLSESFADLDLKGLRIAVDCANGGASRIAPKVLRHLGAEVIPLASAPDGDNINDGCGAVYPEMLAREVVRKECDLGFALDGDGDRSIFVDAEGRILDGDRILYLLGGQMLQEGQLPHRTVVATVMSNLGLKNAFAELGIALEIVDVGDRKVVESMTEGAFALGGEQSGHIVLAENHCCGDGIYTALAVLSVMRKTGRPLADLASAFRPYPQKMTNLAVAEKRPLEECGKLGQAIRIARNQLGVEGRVLVRYSGTENLLRIMVEGPDEETIEQIVTSIAEAAAEEIPTP